MSKKGVLIIFVVFLLALSFISARNFTIYNSTNPSQAYFSIDGTTGRVGIGTMNALQGLHVIGNILANGTINATRDICIQGGICLSGIAITASGEPLWTGNWTNVAFTNTHETFNENVTFMKNISFSTNTGGIQGIYFRSPYWGGVERLAFGADSTGTIIQSADSDVGDGIHFKPHNGGNDLMIINNTGYVGIGTSSPQEVLHVAGNARIDGTLNTNSNKIINVANGTNAQDAVTYSQLVTQNASMRNYVNLQNTSQTNLINLNNQSVTNYINSVASIGEPNWNANYSNVAFTNIHETFNENVTFMKNINIGSSAYYTMSEVQIHGSNPSISLEVGTPSMYVDWKLENTGGNFSIYEGYSVSNQGEWRSAPRFSILSGGSVGIGTASPSSLLEIQGSGVAGNLTLSNSDTTLSAGDIIGEIGFKSYDTSTQGTKVKAYVRGVAQSEFTSSDHRSQIEFGTATGTGDPTTKMTITGEGNVNLSANVNLTMSGGNQIGSNSTCIIIKGPTSRLEIC